MNDTAERLDEAACRRLWASVVAQLIRDAARDDTDGHAARDWLRRPDVSVLEMAGLCPDAVRQRLLALVPSTLRPGKARPVDKRRVGRPPRARVEPDVADAEPEQLALPLTAAPRLRRAA